MIEFNQAAQCLFCPQRRKIALLLKVVMAASAAIIMGLFLFLPRPGRVATPSNSGNLDAVSLAAARTQSLRDTTGGLLEGPAQDAVSKRSLEIREQAQKRFQEVQVLLRPLLIESPTRLAEARELLEGLRKQLLTTKLLVLGDDLFSGSSRAEAHKLLTLEALEKELGVLSEQAKLLSQLTSPSIRNPAILSLPPAPPPR